MKKILSVSLVVVLALALCIPAMAAAPAASGWVAQIDVGNSGTTITAQNVLTEGIAYSSLIIDLSTKSSDYLGGVSPREYFRVLVVDKGLTPKVFYASSAVTLSSPPAVAVLRDAAVDATKPLSDPGTYLLNFKNGDAQQPVLLVISGAAGTSSVAYHLKVDADGLYPYGLYYGYGSLEDMLPTPSIWAPDKDLAYRVKLGETFEGIAFNYYGKYSAAAAIKAANAEYLKRTNGVLEATAVITLPLKGLIAPITPCDPANFAGLWLVKSGDTLSKIASYLYGTPDAWTVIYQANAARVKATNLIYPGQWLVIVK